MRMDDGTWRLEDGGWMPNGNEAYKSQQAVFYLFAFCGHFNVNFITICYSY